MGVRQEYFYSTNGKYTGLYQFKAWYTEMWGSVKLSYLRLSISPRDSFSRFNCSVMSRMVNPDAIYVKNWQVRKLFIKKRLKYMYNL